jgi:pilus assembly protein CpaB
LVSRKLLFGLGVLALLSGVLLVVLWLHGSAPPKVVVAAQIPTQMVLRVTRALPAGALLRPPDMTWGSMPAAEVTGKEIVRGSATETEFVGAVTRQAFQAGDPLNAGVLIKPGDRDFLITALRPGFRAVTINVDAAQSEAGLVLPDDRVDVMLTQNFSAPGTEAGRRSVGETVLRRLRVIAVDQTLVQVDKPAAPSSTMNEPRLPKTVTLEVTEHQAAVLLVAEQLGKIQLLLLGQQDQDKAAVADRAEAPPTWGSDVSQALPDPDLAAAGAARGGPIDVIHGAKIEHLCPTPAGLHACP